MWTAERLGGSFRIARIAAALIVVAAAGALSAGCRGDRTDEPPRRFFPGLDDQPRFENQGGSDFFADGRQMRQPPDGVVAFGRRASLSYGSTQQQEQSAERRIDLQRQDLLRNDQRVYEGRNPDDSYVQRAPLRGLFGLDLNEPVPEEMVRRLLEEGREQYNIYCINCHGGLGEGQGMVGVRWSYTLPNLHDAVYQPDGERGQDGYIFNIIRNGMPNEPGQQPRLRMPSYAEQISPRQAWGVVLYLRALQRTRKGSIEDAPDTVRSRLLRERPAPQQQSSENQQPEQDG